MASIQPQPHVGALGQLLQQSHNPHQDGTTPELGVPGSSLSEHMEQLHWQDPQASRIPPSAGGRSSEYSNNSNNSSNLNNNNNINLNNRGGANPGGNAVAHTFNSEQFGMMPQQHLRGGGGRDMPLSYPGASKDGGGGGGMSAPAPQSLEREQHTKHLLREINALPNKEGVLMFVANYLPKLDLINQVTCLYRLAKMYNSLHPVSMKQQWRFELCRHPFFNLLLDSIKASVSTAKESTQSGRIPNGLDSRCMSNLVWALVRLELTADTSVTVVTILQDAALLVENLTPHCSLQGLASLLWGFAKLPQPPLRTNMRLIRRITELLSEAVGVAMFDAQALSNSVWSLAHMAFMLGTKAPEVLIEAATEAGADIQLFLTLIGDSTVSMLKSLHMGMGSEETAALDVGHTARTWLQDTEQKFSNQSLLNIAWSFMTILGTTYTQYNSVQLALKYIRLVIFCKLRASAAVLRDRLSNALYCLGSFNEQALSNFVCAFDGTLGLDLELMRMVFLVAALRIKSFHGTHISFKPKEVMTLVSAANRMPEADPWEFLSALTRAVDAAPAGAMANWQPCEQEAYTSAMASLAVHYHKLHGPDANGNVAPNAPPPPLLRPLSRSSSANSQQTFHHHQQHLSGGGGTGAAPFGRFAYDAAVGGRGGGRPGGGAAAAAALAAQQQQHSHALQSQFQKVQQQGSLHSASMELLMARRQQLPDLTQQLLAMQLNHPQAMHHSEAPGGAFGPAAGGSIESRDLSSISAPPTFAPFGAPLNPTSSGSSDSQSFVLELMKAGLLVPAGDAAQQQELWMRLASASNGGGGGGSAGGSSNVSGVFGGGGSLGNVSSAGHSHGGNVGGGFGGGGGSGSIGGSGVFGGGGGGVLGANGTIGGSAAFVGGLATMAGGSSSFGKSKGSALLGGGGISGGGSGNYANHVGVGGGFVNAPLGMLSGNDGNE